VSGPPLAAERASGPFPTIWDLGRSSAPNDAPRDRPGPIGAIGEAAAAGGALGAGVSAAGRGVSTLPNPLAKVVGGAMQAGGPVSAALGGAAGGAAGETVRQTGQNTLGPMTEPAAIAAGVATPYGVQKAGRSLFHTLLGVPSEMGETLAPIARKQGFVLEPAQVRADRGISTPGRTPEVALHNQQVANRMVTERAGAPSGTVDQAWLKATEDRLGQEFARIYSPQNTFTIPAAETDALLTDLVREMTVGSSASVTAAKGALYGILGHQDYNVVDNILKSGGNLQDVLQSLGGRNIALQGDVLGRVRTDLARVVRSAADPTDRHVAGEIIGTIDRSVQTTNPTVAAQLAYVRPQYRAWATLMGLQARGGINEGNVSLEMLGDMLRRRDPTYHANAPAALHPLAEAGILGETFGLRNISQASQAEAPIKELTGLAKAALKMTGTKIPAGGLGAAAGFGLGGPAGAAAGGLTGIALDAARRGKLGQLMQLQGAAPMRNGAKWPLPAQAGAVGAGQVEDE
jgi:hypothetical protein